MEKTIDILPTETRSPYDPKVPDTVPTHPLSEKIYNLLCDYVEEDKDRILGKILSFAESLGGDSPVIKARKDMLKQLLFADLSIYTGLRALTNDLAEWLQTQHTNHDIASDRKETIHHFNRFKSFNL